MSGTYSTERTKNFICGTDYQKLWLMLFFRRAVNRKYSFRLATEMSAVAGFDDIVFRYEQNGTTVYMLIQVKHKEDNSKKICVGNLLTKSGDLDLAKHFAAFLKVQGNKELKGKIKEFFFVTNADFDFKNLASRKITVEKIGTQDDFLNIGDSARYKLIDLGGNIARYLKQNKDFINAKLGRANDKEISDKEIEGFLSNLVFAVNLPNDTELEKLIKDEISNELAARFRYYDENNIVFNDLFVKMSSWMKNKNGPFLSHEEGEEFFREVEKFPSTLCKVEKKVEKGKRGIYKIAEQQHKDSKTLRKIHSAVTIKSDKKIEKPIKFNMKYPVKTFTGRESKLKEIHKELQKNTKAEVLQLVAISGLGGIGKSELARKYACEYKEFYDGNIIWINAEDSNTMESSFLRLASRLGVSTKDKGGDKKAIETIIEEIYAFFEDVNSLFIFDNAEEYEDISKFLPFSLDHKPYILITSRDRKWEAREEGDIEVILLDEFDEIEALEFVKKALNIQDNLQDKEIEELTEELQHFPLALGQAVAYIHNKNKELSPRRKFVISDYLKEYRQEAEKLFKEIEKLLEDEGKECESAVRYTKTVLTTWNITRNRIVDNTEHGKQAVDVLNIMAYLAPDNIDIEEIFAKPIADNEQRLWDAVKLLDRYSMINLREKIVNIHRLVQKVTRLKLREDGQKEETLRKALELINSNCIARESISHITSIWEYASKHSKLIDDFYFNSFYTHEESSFIKKSTPLCLLAQNGSYDAIKTILTHVEKHHSDRLKEVIDIENNCGLTPLHIAAGGGRLNVVRCLVNKGANIYSGYGGYTPLYLAARLGELSVVRYLNSKGADINSKNAFGGTALHVAAYRGKLNVVRYLVSKGADINADSAEPFFNGTPLHCAVHSERPSVVKYLINKGANIDAEDKEGKTPLYRAAGGENLNIVKCLVEKGADICARSQKGMIPLCAAAKCGSISIIKYFISMGVNVNFRNEYGNTMLHIAAGNGNLSAVRYFTRMGVHTNAKNKSDETPLHFAARRPTYEGDMRIVEHLIYKGAFIHAQNKDERTPLHFAARNGSSDVVEYLIQEGTRIDDRDKDGNTPLHFAAMRGKVDTAKVLLKYNAESLLSLKALLKDDVELFFPFVNAKNNEGMTALHYATNSNHKELVELLLAHNAHTVSEST